MRGRTKAALALAAALAIPAEGLRQIAYHDPVGVLTVCWGATGDIDPRRVYSLDECRARLDADMLEAIGHVERCVPGLQVRMLAAWSDAVFNLGPRIVCDQKTSTAARLLAAGQRIEACQELPRWNKARVAGVLVALPGLTKRRAKEMRLCLSETT